MNNQKFCFIMCSNNAQLTQEAISYIERLDVPDGYIIEILTIQDASSMTSGYNEGMYASDAKYKIYLHQDVFILHSRFLFELLDIFSNEKVGMIGMIGVTKMPENGIMWYGHRVGQIYSNHIYETFCLQLNDATKPYQNVDAIDGLLMATQYDIPWREDLFKQWDFYDASQSYEFRNAGYDVVVPYTKHPWVLHDDGFMKLQQYYENRLKFLEEYL